MMKRPRVEKDLRRLFSEDKLGATIYSPLAGGLLSGKYNEGD
jgi:aryl-alcohol dehydrogenase-like predicted oxidoreductase